MKPLLAAVAILLALSAGTVAEASAARRSVIVTRTTTTTVTTRVLRTACRCVGHRRAWRALRVVRHAHLWGSDYWMLMPPWATSLAAAPYE